MVKKQQITCLGFFYGRNILSHSLLLPGISG
jgi:hypothetical protein